MSLHYCQQQISKGVLCGQTDIEGLELEEYDAGYLGGSDDCDAEWWHDYMRAELGRAYEFYQDQLTEMGG